MNLFGTNTAETTNIVDLLRNDHIAVKALFHEFQSATDARERRRIAEQALTELIRHAGAEEEIFYPAIRDARGTAETGALMDEANEEHHVAKVLIRELEAMREVDARYRAKFTVLSELVKHHVTEEESEIFPLARTSGLDLEKLGAALVAAKERAMARWRRPKAGNGKTARRNGSTNGAKAKKRKRVRD